MAGHWTRSFPKISLDRPELTTASLAQFWPTAEPIRKLVEMVRDTHTAVRRDAYLTASGHILALGLTDTRFSFRNRSLLTATG